MHWEAVAVIGSVTVVLGVVLFIPGLMWAQKQARANPEAQAGMTVTKAGFAFGGLWIVALFGGFAAQFWAPDSVFGTWVSTSAGRFIYTAAVLAAAFVVEYLLRLFGVRIVALRKQHDV
jgi:hypothetical protein